MQRQSNSLPRSIIFSLLAVPWSAGGLSAGGQTGSKGQRDKADTASLPQLVQPGLGLGARSGSPVWSLGGNGFSLSLALLAKTQQPQTSRLGVADFQVPYFSPLIPPRLLRRSWNSGLLSVWMAFHLWWEDRGNDDQTLSLGDSAELIMGFTQHC